MTAPASVGMPPQSDELQDRYFERAVYRSPSHPAVRSYALPKIEYLARALPLHAQRILDVGCGNGVFTVPLAEQSPRTVGLDRSANMLRQQPWRQLVRGTAETLPFPDRAFTLVFEANLLHHTRDPLAIVHELRRVSSDYVVLVEPNALNPLMFMFGLLVKAERGTLRSNRRGLVSLASRAGLHVVSAAAMGMISQNLTPTILVPLLKIFDREFALGEYLVVIARRT
jgi:SAM-dependent methyltransferase